MNKKIYDKVHLINHIISEMESLYHQVSLKMGISDSVSIVLYTIHVTEGICLLSDIYKKSDKWISTIKRLQDFNLIQMDTEILLPFEKPTNPSKSQQKAIEIVVHDLTTAGFKAVEQNNVQKITSFAVS